MNIDDCVDACSRCHQVCLQTAMSHCLETGGDHVEPDHFRLMMSCARICEISVELQLSQSPYAKTCCALCVEACEACAKSCEALDNMEECVQVCRECAERCRAMVTH